MNVKKWLGLFAISLCATNCAPAQISGKGTTVSADGEVQIQTEFPSGKVTILRPTEIEMEAFRRRGQDGDVAAQLVLAEVEYARKNPTEGERWLRLAAESGNSYAEYTLAAELCFALHGGLPRPNEGVLWMKLSAYEGYAGAQAHLATCYRRGLGVPKDTLEAYAWFLIYLRNPALGERSVVPPGLEESLSREQIERARARCKNYVPSVTERNPLVDAGFIKLKAISESNGKPIVLLNDQAFTAGEQKKVTTLGGAVEVRCVEVRSNSVIIATEPYWQRGELRPVN
jgi:hypothetical protein